MAYKKAWIFNVTGENEKITKKNGALINKALSYGIITNKKNPCNTMLPGFSSVLIQHI
jgi:hypothetical protein